MKRKDESAVIRASLLILAGGFGFGWAMHLQSQLSGVLKILVAGIGFALPAFCGVQARKLFKGRHPQE